MKKMIPCLAFFLFLVTLAPCLHAAQPAPATQADLLAQILAPAGTTATASPADPGKTAPSDLFLPKPKMASCTYVECISECNDCPWGHTNYCISLEDCFCGCR
ncbi:MAG TPA: hypothetical protein VGM86_12330 [Thermoanaerobaculia bacterium]